MRLYSPTRCTLKILAVLACAIFACSSARADVSLLLEEPFGRFGAMNPTGHAAVWLDRVCADTPTHLRPCEAGERGVVLSRYHRVDGYDWLAMPLLAYLYAVDDPSEVPESATPKLELKLRDAYRREHLADLVPDDPEHEIPGGDWIQLVGASYDRRIWGFQVATTREQDAALIARFNHRRNISHFNLFFNNCANFSQKILNFYYPHAIHRNFIADLGMMTPKQAAKSLVKYSRHHPETDLYAFVIPQVPGTIDRSTKVNGVIESLVKSKKYVLPLTYLNPWVTGGLVVAYFGGGRFHPDHHAAIFDPTQDEVPGVMMRTTSSAETIGSSDAAPSPAPMRDVSSDELPRP
ncbi:MAG TPA: hypothetical protein VHE33_12335 [Acidobacteriaceae bacterium]|nr:hypothetical protein [Acidobacteriaceae bacterium]